MLQLKKLQSDHPMGKPSKREKVLNWFLQNNFPSGIISFDDLVVAAARMSLGVGYSEAEKYANRNVNSLWANFVSMLRKESKLGINPIAHIVDEETHKIESYFSKLSRFRNKRAIRLSCRLAMRPAIYNKIESLNDREYEALCCLACNKLGASNIHLTPRGNEGGIDFLALIERPRIFPKCSGLTRFRIVGQAKKHSDPVQVGHIRDFSDTLEDTRRHSPQVLGHLPAWFKESSTPIIGWMVGHRGFQGGGESKARMNGIMLFDSRVLTEIIVLSSDIGSTECDEIVAQRMASSCREILKNS